MEVSISMVGVTVTVMPSASEAVVALGPRLDASELRTVSAVEEAGTATVAVISTEAAATLMVTNDACTAAAAAILCCRPVVLA